MLKIQKAYTKQGGYCLLKPKGWTGIEYSDVVVLIGLVLLGVGLWLFHPWISLTVIGIIIVLLGIWR